MNSRTEYHSKFGNIILWFLMMCLSMHVYSQTIDKSTTHGLSIQVGTGIPYGGNGFLVDYQIKQSDKIRIIPTIGYGFSKGGTDLIDATFLNAITGINVSYGNRHQVFGGMHIFIGTSTYTKTNLPNISSKQVVAPTFNFGYKFTSMQGFIFQLTGGMIYISNPYITSEKLHLEPHIGIGIGYKF